MTAVSHPQLNLESYIANLFSDPQLLRMGHGQGKDDLNLGLGWIYYGLARAIRPKLAVVIGSYRGFVPSVIAKALLDNGDGGKVAFIDPSLVDDFWREPERVKAHFQQLGTPNIQHYLHTTQDFVQTPDYAEMAEIGLLMVDGLHTAEQAQFDYECFLPKLSQDAVCLFHDSLRIRESKLYGVDKAYQHTVRSFMHTLEGRDDTDILTLPIAEGLSLVKRRPPASA